MKAQELISSLLPTLTRKERQRIAFDLRMSVCEREGHNYRPAGVKINWFTSPSVVIVCTKCGSVLKS